MRHIWSILVIYQRYWHDGYVGFEAFQPPIGKGAMDGADRLKGRPGMSKQDVCEWRAKPTAPEASRAVIRPQILI